MLFFTIDTLYLVNSTMRSLLQSWLREMRDLVLRLWSRKACLAVLVSCDNIFRVPEAAGNMAVLLAEKIVTSVLLCVCLQSFASLAVEMK